MKISYGKGVVFLSQLSKIKYRSIGLVVITSAHGLPKSERFAPAQEGKPAMNPAFEQLPEQKQQRIINAALEVFSKSDYQHASTDLIAAKAEISKGLLFYYFENKRTLYLCLVHYMTKETADQVASQDFWAITDFFELLAYAEQQKMQALSRNPCLLNFSVRFFYETHRDVEAQVNAFNQTRMRQIPADYFGRIDRGKFRDGMTPEQVLKMLLWMTDGYLHQQLCLGQPICINQMMAEYRQWLKMFRQIAYREEYQL